MRDFRPGDIVRFRDPRDEDREHVAVIGNFMGPEKFPTAMIITDVDHRLLEIPGTWRSATLDAPVIEVVRRRSERRAVGGEVIDPLQRGSRR